MLFRRTFINHAIKFSKFLSKHIQLVKSELCYLRIIFDRVTQITALKYMLNDHNTKVKHQKYPAAKNVPTRNTDLDLLCVESEHCKAADWGDAYI